MSEILSEDIGEKYYERYKNSCRHRGFLKRLFKEAYEEGKQRRPSSSKKDISGEMKENE